MAHRPIKIIDFNLVTFKKLAKKGKPDEKPKKIQTGKEREARDPESIIIEVILNGRLALPNGTQVGGSQAGIHHRGEGIGNRAFLN